MSKRQKREHWGGCAVRIIRDPESHWGIYPTMEGAIEALDPFNETAYWPLRNVIPYLGRMGA